jgi:hypothetical protein
MLRDRNSRERIPVLRQLQPMLASSLQRLVVARERLADSLGERLSGQAWLLALAS